jgi:hypothetical protein
VGTQFRFRAPESLDEFVTETQARRVGIRLYKVALTCRSSRATNHETAVALARLPERIRGYGHIKDAGLAAARVEPAKLLAEFRSAPPPHALAAE